MLPPTSVSGKTAAERADDDADEERRDDLTGNEDERERGDCREQAPEPNVLALRGDLACAHRPEAEEHCEHAGRIEPASGTVRAATARRGRAGHTDVGGAVTTLCLEIGHEVYC